MNFIINTLNNNYPSKLCQLKWLLNNYCSDDWKKYISFSDISYKRNVIYKSDIFEVVLICWKPGQKTIKHNHTENGCLFKVMDGIIHEKLYTYTKECYDLNIYSNKDVCYIDNNIGEHIMCNYSKKNTITLHIYSK